MAAEPETIYLGKFWPTPTTPASVIVEAEVVDDGYSVTVTFADGTFRAVGGTFGPHCVGVDERKLSVLYKTVGLLAEMLATELKNNKNK